MTFFLRSGIRVATIGDKREVILSVDTDGSTFSLPEPGVYSLEGDNQSGKSLLIKALMSVRVRGLEILPGEGALILNGNAIQVRDINDAIRAGVVAVFQDDQLIPSMTVEEQVLLRHANPGFATFYAWMYEFAHGSFVTDLLDEVHPSLELLTKHLRPKEHWLHPAREVRAEAASLLERYGFLETTQKLPSELSGGAKAAARLVQAQLTPNIRVLLLDEAFAGVDEKTLPTLVNVVRDWQLKNETAVLVVTHNASERQLWNPRQSFVVKNRKVLSSGTAQHKSLFSGLPARHPEFRAFEVSTGVHSWLPEQLDGVVVMVDASVRTAESTSEILQYCADACRQAPLTLEIHGGEISKSLNTYHDLVASVCRDFRPGRLAFVVIGGGVCLNIGGFLGATIHRGKYPTFYVPTTVMAMADVAVGSKTGVNLRSQSRPLKHTIGSYLNPAGIVLDHRYLTTLPVAERLRGLSECLKHGLLQDADLFSQVSVLIAQRGQDVNGIYQAALRTMDLKSRILRRDPWEENVGRILMYGHLHAHSFERASGLTLSHGDSVFLGLLVEVYLGQGGASLFSQVWSSVAPVMRDLDLRIPWSFPELRDAYEADNYDDYQAYDVVLLSDIGCYGEPLVEDLPTRPVHWNDIRGAIEAVKAYLEDPVSDM